MFLDLLRQQRSSLGLTQADIAIRLDATQSFISKVERGERRLDLVELHSWCAALGISLGEFVTRFERAVGECHTASPM